MNTGKILKAAAAAAIGLGVLCGGAAIAEPAKEQPANAAMQLPPGWTPEDAQACAMAATPGKMHEHLAKGLGVWQGKNTLWMYEGAEPVKTDSTTTVSSFLDGRFVKCEMSGEMMGMGPYSGFAIYGYDNVANKFQGTWVDNMGTGMAIGTGELSADGKTMTWSYTFHCPITKKPTVLREVETITGADSKKLEMFTANPKTGKEFKMMEIELTRKPGTAAAK